MSDSDCLAGIAKKCLNYREKCRKRQLALKSLQNYINQLKIHFDINDRDIVKILKHIVKMEDEDNFIKKCGIYLIKKLK